MKIALSVCLALLTSSCVLVPMDGYGGSSGGGKAGGDTVLLCHKGKKTMELPREAAEGHLGHGDSRGPC
ncbi:MAG: hypothetical protein Q8Q73_16085 [Stagnimonas sp.]|nr:hypothetical protein [Stagnimonas sp.]